MAADTDGSAEPAGAQARTGGAAEAPGAPVLDFREQVFVNFRRFDFAEPGGHAYRWLDVKHFDLGPRPPDDRGLLEALIGHVQFRDGYAGDGANEAGGWHGSYRLDAVTADAYEPVSAQEAEHTVRTWAEGGGPVPAALAAALEQAAYQPIRAATGRYRLRELGRDAFHVWGGVHIEFHELVLVDRRAGTLALLVGADD
ncbi:hypothetical protein [Allonocardiopsis opalescens]|uniref:Uncharacterized protein n=1 Tax=Allonocardiopsis opalescens TaxID=1144618 RepID=A0A2T0Q873_9ACTN|nr:hypothetical protein [Allonocardiopsis opalescens]PRY00020.1 hypothetical protein CLV72_103630 [Allonocardiopsis opalescens]